MSIFAHEKPQWPSCPVSEYHLLNESNRLHRGALKPVACRRNAIFPLRDPCKMKPRSNCNPAVALSRRERVVHRIGMIMADDMIRR